MVLYKQVSRFLVYDCFKCTSQNNPPHRRRKTEELKRWKKGSQSEMQGNVKTPLLTTLQIVLALH